MFEEYAKKLEKLGEDVPKIFKNVAQRGANHARKQAIEYTDEEKLVDTGAYKGSWNGTWAETSKDTYAIILQNGMEYASFLEDGHKLRNGGWWKGRFVGKRTLIDTEGWALLELENEVAAAMLAKKAGITKSQAKKYLK